MLNSLVGINYSKIFQSVLQDEKVRSMMADFMVYCFEECVELEDSIITKFEKNDKLKNIIDKRILELAKERDMKDKIVSRIKQ